jgi:hypothetical protein
MYNVNTVGISHFPGGEADGAWKYPPFRMEIKMRGALTLLSPCTFMALCYAEDQLHCIILYNPQSLNLLCSCMRIKYELRVA